jgi:myo-inositol-1(or 4)-monophosphatase
MSYLSFAVELARQAGQIILAGLDDRPAIKLKGAFNVVTAVDRASEDLIVAAIRRAYPDHAILAEEGSEIAGESAYQWLIDPLDGTNNYAHGFPFFSVSIGLLHEGAPLIGVVFDPLREQFFTAERGSGAFCNERRLQVSATPRMEASLVSTGFPYNFGTTPQNNLRQFERVQSRTQGVRRAGSAALDLCYVAAGWLDAHWELRLNPWDSAAGAILIEEAGGTITDWEGNPWTPFAPTMLATNGRIHTELLEVLQKTES